MLDGIDIKRKKLEVIDIRRELPVMKEDESDNDLTPFLVGVIAVVFFLIDAFEYGLSIGSYLSQFLANYYLSKAYIYASQQFKVRKRKDGTVKKVRIASHVLFQMDDIIFFGRSKKDMKPLLHGVRWQCSSCCTVSTI